jgi:subtilisin family serine protease
MSTKWQAAGRDNQKSGGKAESNSASSVYNNQSLEKGGNAVKKQWWKNGWMMLAVLLSASGVSSAQADGTIAVKEDGKADRRIVRTQADKAQNRHWAEGDFEGVLADTGDGQTLAVLNPDKSAKWIVVFDRPAISKELKKRSVHLQQDWAAAGALRQEIAQEHKQAIDDWKANRLITKVNARFDMLINGVAVEATGEQIEEIAKQSGVAAVHPDYMMQINLADSVPLIGAPDVWAMNDADGNPVTGSGIRVAVIDTGIDYTHSAVGSCTALNTGATCRVIGGYDFANSDADPKDDNNHGTHVAGIIAGSDATITGVAPEASLYAYKVCNSGGSCQTSHIIAALERAADPDGDANPADHVNAANLSLGGPGGPTDSLSVAVDQAVDQGISVVVSSGNSGSSYSSVGAPGAAAKAITVGASSKADTLASFSSRGPVTGYILKPDLVAPGVAIKSSVRNGGYAAYDGTSMAAPHVTGAVALLKQLHPAWTPAQLKAAVANSARDLSLNPFAQGSGRLQLAEAASSSYLATPNSLSMGLVDNTVPVWSKTQALTIYNDAADAQTIDLSIGGTLPAGLTASLSQNSVTLAAGASQDVSFTLTVDNNVLPYPSAKPYSYNGKVVLDNGVQVRQVPFAVIKSAQLTLNWDTPPTFVRIHNRKSGGSQPTIVQPASPYLVLLPPDTYDIISWWSSGNYTVVNEGVVLTGSTTRNISRSEASHVTNFQLRDHTGNVQPVVARERSLAIWQPSTGNGLMVGSFGGKIPFSGFVSDVSEAYHYGVTGLYQHEEANVWYASIFGAQNVSSDIDIVNDYTSANRVSFIYNVSDSELKRLYFIGRGGSGSALHYPSVPNLTAETWYLFQIPKNSYYNTHSIWLRNSTDSICYSVGNNFTPTSDTSYTMQVRNYNPVTGSYLTEQIEYSDSSWQVNGSPHYWAANTKNTTSAIVITSNAGSQAWFNYVFVRSQWQDQYNVDVNDVTYELLNSGGSPVQSGTLGSSYSQTINAQQGAYTLNTSYPGLLRGNPTAGTMTATFDTSKSDKNPPVIQELQIRQAGERTDTVADGAGQVAVRAADASTFTVEIAVDWGNGWQNLTVNTNGAFQTANIPAFHPSEDKEVSLRITLTDASGNKMVNTIAPAFIVQKSEVPAWTLAVNSSGANSVAITGSPSDYSGTTNYSKTDIPEGIVITLTAPAAGSASMTFSSWSGCDATDAAARTCTVTMSADKTVTANFLINKYTVTPSAGTGGSISPNTPQTVDHGATTQFTVTPSTGYSIDTVTGCGGTLSGSAYTTGAITEHCAVTAQFKVQSTLKRVLFVNSAGAFGVPVAAAPAQYGGRAPYARLAPASTSITLTAPPQARKWGWFGPWRTFSHWQGCNSTDAAARTCSIVMSASRSVKAVYQ